MRACRLGGRGSLFSGGLLVLGTSECAAGGSVPQMGRMVDERRVDFPFRALGLVR